MDKLLFLHSTTASTDEFVSCSKQHTTILGLIFPSWMETSFAIYFVHFNSKRILTDTFFYFQVRFHCPEILQNCKGGAFKVYFPALPWVFRIWNDPLELIPIIIIDSPLTAPL